MKEPERPALVHWPAFGKTVVNLEKLAKQLRRDMAANPKKAVALGLMVLVALYFWGPLLAKWMSGNGSKRAGTMDTANLILTDDPSEPTQQSRSRSGAKFRWERVRQLMQQDAAMRPAAFDPTWVDPFAKSSLMIAQEQAAAAAVKATPEQAAPVAVAPSSLSIVLGGVFVSGKSRIATINGEACREGDTLVVSGKDDKSVTQPIRVVQIHRTGVMVEVNGAFQTIELSTPGLARGDEIQRQRFSN